LRSQQILLDKGLFDPCLVRVQQAASRSALHVPVEADKIFEEAAKALDNNPWHEKSRKQVLSDWVVDLSRPTPGDASGRLGNLVADMDHMAIKDDKQDH
jgi:hypothetical protein